MFVGLRVFADESKYPFIGFVICAEGYSVQLAVMLHVLGEKNITIYSSYERGHKLSPFLHVFTVCIIIRVTCGCQTIKVTSLDSLLSWDQVSSHHKWRSAVPLWGSSVPQTFWCASETAGGENTIAKVRWVRTRAQYSLAPFCSLIAPETNISHLSY